MSLNEIKNRTDEVFSYILLFCPEFSDGRRTTIATEFERLTGLVHLALDKVRSEDARKWIRICLQELQQAQRSYETGDRKAGCYLIQKAQEHFKSAFTNKAIAPRFIVGSSGPATDQDSGFPE